MTALRGRFVAALVLCSAVTLALAAVLLLSPLESHLRRDELDSLELVVKGNRSALVSLGSDAITRGSRELAHSARALRRRTGAEVTIVSATGRVLAATDPERGRGSRLAIQALQSDRSKRTVVTTPEGAMGRVAVPMRIDDRPIVIEAELLLDDASQATGVVRRAFARAAAISLAIALLLGLLLAGRLVRRLRALRDTALRVAELGPVVEMRADTTRDEVGDLTRALTTMQERLHDQEQARRAFVATASHELRTPLSSLRIMLDMLRDDLEGEPDLADARIQAAKADQQAERLAGLAAELLDLSRIDASVPLRSELVELGEVARAVIAEFDEPIAHGGHAVFVECPQAVWAVSDPSAVAQVFRILVDNALRHGPAGGAIAVSIDSDAQGRPRLGVTDDGPGIAAAERTRIFERFERGSNPQNVPGFGLGLAIARELARRMGGELSVAEDKATTTFVLVLMPAPADEGA